MAGTLTAADATGPMPGSRPDSLWRRVLSDRRILIGGGTLLLVVLVSICTLPFTLRDTPGGTSSADQPNRWYFDSQDENNPRIAPTLHVKQDPYDDKSPYVVATAFIFGTDDLGRSIAGRCLVGGVISLAVGIAAAGISILLGVTIGMIAGFKGGWVDAGLMRTVDILYGLPYLLQVILFKVAFEPNLEKITGSAQAANIIVMFVAIGLVSWLTMARVVRGQVLSLRGQPFVEAARAMGVPEIRIFLRHMLPNLAGPIIVYATLTVPQAVLQESFLSFLGIGVKAPIPSWGSLAKDGLTGALNPQHSEWWRLAFPCALLAMTLLCLNYLGDGLRDVFDPRKEAAKI